MTTFSASLMCGNLLDLKNEIKILKRYDIDYLHMDIMDGHFVPNITFGFDTVNAIKNILPKDIHLMVESPENAIGRLRLYEGDMVTFHIECKGNIPKLIKDLKDKGVKVGIAINPKTSVEHALEYFDDINHILIMTVEPGFAGQPFESESYEKIRKLTALINQHRSSITIGVDGAIGFEQIRLFSEIGVSHFVLGTSALFNGDLIQKAQEVNNLKNRMEVAI